jgi:hypothetical protein
MTLEGIEDDLPGIRQILASYQKMQMTVEYDEARVRRKFWRRSKARGIRRKINFLRDFLKTLH